MTGIEALVPLLLVLPMAGFLVTAAIGRRLGKAAHWIPVLAILAVWLIAMGLVASVLSGSAPLIPGTDTHGYEMTLFRWIPAGEFTVDLGIYIDPLTACLLIVVTTIGLLVHVYSIGYMSHDPGYSRFFAYLNLFMFSMLLLVLSSSWLVVFVAWDLVGIVRGHWSYSERFTSGIMLGPMPLEELLFFLVIPICGLLTYEAVGWVLNLRGRVRARGAGRA